jgi:hypothetical protein
MVETDEILICCLLYGDHHELHSKFLNKLYSSVPDDVHVIFWCNEICQETLDLLLSFPKSGKRQIFYSPNVGKYQAMKIMFRNLYTYFDHKKWVVWFDDDSIVEHDDWLFKTASYIDSLDDRVVCIGKSLFSRFLPGQEQFIRASSWYTGRPPKFLDGLPGADFTLGAYWCGKVSFLKEINWPDSRLNHNGGDTLLGAAVWQQNKHLHDYTYGVNVNSAPRRGFQETPAGALEG